MAAAPIVALVGAVTVALAFALTGGSAAAAAPVGPWPFSAIDVPAERPDGEGVRVAIVDSGIDPHRPAFAGRINATVDCINSDSHGRACRDGGVDDSGHGTHIAGIVSARAYEGGPVGVAPASHLLIARSLRNACDDVGGAEECRALGQLEDVVAGVRWATREGAQLINLSIDAGVDLDWEDGVLTRAIRDAWTSGAVVIASTGNGAREIDDPDLRRVPLLLVGAVDAHGELTSYSNVAPTARWALLGPGGEAGGECPAAGVLSTYPTKLEAAGTGCLSGTSMAAAYVTGALASLVGSGLKPHDALAHLVATARDTDDGALVDLDAALNTPIDVTDARQPLEAMSATAPNESATNGGWVSVVSLDQWTEVHPMRTRALGLLAGAIGIALIVTSRRRPRFTVSY